MPRKVVSILLFFLHYLLPLKVHEEAVIVVCMDPFFHVELTKQQMMRTSFANEKQHGRGKDCCRAQDNWSFLHTKVKFCAQTQVCCFSAYKNPIHKEFIHLLPISYKNHVRGKTFL
jgi:hypothetical protein